MLLVTVILAIEASVAVAVLAAAALLLTAGVGLLRRRAWGWPLSLFVGVSGATVVVTRLLVTGGAEWPSLLPALSADLVLIVVLQWERPRRPAQS